MAAKITNIEFEPYLHGMWTGGAIVCLALLLHPMNPDDILAFLWQDPLALLNRNIRGHQLAWLFIAATSLFGVATIGAIQSLYVTLRTGRWYVKQRRLKRIGRYRYHRVVASTKESGAGNFRFIQSRSWRSVVMTSSGRLSMVSALGSGVSASKQAR